MPDRVKISYRADPGAEYQATVVIKDESEHTQATWRKGNFYETQRHGMLNFVYRKFRGGVFIDIGAAIGNHSLFFAKCCRADQVYAFEPVRPLYDHLLENLRLNRLRKVHAFPLALGEAPGEVGIRPSSVPPAQGGSLMGRVDQAGSGVRMERLDDVLHREGVSQVTLIKIDVEGYSLPVLIGARHTLQAHHPAVFCECETDENFHEVDDYLSALGYQVWEIDGRPFAMNHTPTYLWEWAEVLERKGAGEAGSKGESLPASPAPLLPPSPGEFDVTVLITTYNRPVELCRLLASLMADAGERRILCRVYNDASDLPYPDLPAGTDTFHIEFHHLPHHHGKPGYWQMIHGMFQDLRPVRSRYFLQLPDDVTVQPGFFPYALKTYAAIDDPAKVCLNLYLDSQRIGMACWTNLIPRICKFGQATVFKTGWMDMCFLSERKFFEALDFSIQPIPPSRWQNHPRLSSGVGMQISKRLRASSLYQVRECLLSASPTPSRMNPNRPKQEDMSIARLDPVVCGVASIPERTENLRQTLASVLPFVDEMHVYLNRYPSVPGFLKDPKIAVYRSQDHGDLGDAGKFYIVGRKSGFYLAIDDDILYPEDFTWRLVNEIRLYRKEGRKMAVGIHGKVMSPHVQNYYRGHVRMYHSAAALGEKQGVHILATCGVAFHTNDLQITLADFDGPRNMADIYFSIACQKQNVGCIVLPRRLNYLRVQRIPSHQTIWGRYHNDDRVQTELYNSWREWKIRA